MKKKKILAVLTATAACAAHTATAQFFTNALTNASSVALEFTENMVGSNSVWSYTNDYAVAEDGSTNTVLLGGAVLDYVTADDDSARSYLTTVNSNYLDYSWVARVAVEAPSSTKPWIFVGLGAGLPNASNSYEPRGGESVYLRFQSGVSARKIMILNDHGQTLHNTGAWQGDPGYDFYLTYNHYTKMLKFEVDNWNGGRFSGINVTTPEVYVGDYLTETNNMHLFFGSNAKVTWGDFEVYEIETTPVPAAPQNVYAWPVTNHSATVYWDEVSGASEGYCVYRSLDDVEENYVQIATNVMDTFYTDTAVTVGTTYYYKATAVNSFGESVLSSSEFAVPNEYDIFGVMNNSGADVTRWFYELFDNNPDTFMDDNTTGGYAGLDFGESNSQEIQEIYFWLRGGSFGTGGSVDVVIDGETNTVSRSQGYVYGNVFEGSTNNVDWTVIGTITNTIPQHGQWNEVEVTDMSAYRYVRYYPANGYNNYAMADILFLTSSDFTAKGTPIPWLEQYGLTEADDEVDSDLDGLLNWEEYIAGTVPNDAASVLAITSGSNTVNGMVITWQSVAGKDYSIVTNGSLSTPNKGTAVTGITGLENETSYTTTVYGASTLFYEIGVE